MEVKQPNKEIPIHFNPFIHNNLPSSAEEEEKTSAPTLDPSHQEKYKDLSPSPGPSPRAGMIRYRECQRNHAAHLGSHVVDGCGEFMPSGEEGAPLALKCAACDCHRNFHRREVEGETTTNTNTTAAAATVLPLPPAAPSAMTTTNCYISFKNNNLLPVRANTDNNLTVNNTTTPVYLQQGKHPHSRAPVMMAFGGGGIAAESSSDDLNAYRAGNLDYGGQFVEQYGVSKKRFRTKFSQEQKDKMMDFAEKIGWKMLKQDDVQVQRFCHDIGVKRQVFKVWMHNNKQAMKKKQA